MAKLENQYANALLELSNEEKTWEQDLKEAELVRDELSGQDVQAFLVHPHIRQSAKQELLETAFGKKISDNLMGFLFLMVRKNRESIIVPALTEFIIQTNRRLGRIEARVVSAKELTTAHLESIRTVLTKQLQMEVKIHAIVDPAVIGGFYILVDGRIFDGTVRNELNRMKERLKRGGYIGASST